MIVDTPWSNRQEGFPSWLEKKEIVMHNNLKTVLTQMGENYKEILGNGSRHYLEVSIGQKAVEMGMRDIGEQYREAYAIIPLKRPLAGMKVRIDGRSFVNYAQFASGIVVPPYIARQAGLAYRTYSARDSMICNFA